MQHPDEGMIHAWLDGALSATETEAVATHAAGCAQCAAAIAEARGLTAAASRIVSALDAVPGAVIPARRPARRPWYATAQFRAAAAVLLVAGASLLLVRGRAGTPLAEASKQVAGVSVDVPASDAMAGMRSTEAAQAAEAAEPPAMLKSMSPPAKSLAGSAVSDEAATGGLQIVRTDSIAGAWVTVYRVQPGVEVSLTETMPAELPAATAMQRARAPAGNSLAAIEWTDPVTRREYVLSGPVSKERLDEIRKEIERMKD